MTTRPRVLITGNRGLAAGLARRLSHWHVDLAARSEGLDIADVHQWGHSYLDHDAVINCAYSGWHQITVLEYFFQHWQMDANKLIVTIGSTVTDYARIERERDHEYWSYRAHKQALQHSFARMCSTARCDLKLINPGAIDTDMIQHLECRKFDADWVADQVAWLMTQPHIHRIDLWP